jgi:ABC-type uncharacterized transport system permease subunit
MVFLIIGTLILGAITGFAVFGEGKFWWGLGVRILLGLSCMVYFALVGVTFWRFRWKLALLDLVLLFVASNVGFYRYLRRRSDL